MTASMVTPGNVTADIGTDHAYLPIYLCQNNLVPRVIAMDVNSGPLLHAREHVERENLSQKIELRLSNGLEKLHENEVDTIIIAGMGGSLCAEILEKGSAVVLGASEIILQPQSEIWKVRRTLQNLGLTIICEHMVLEDGKYYFHIKAKKGQMKLKMPDLYYGVFEAMVEKKLWKQYLEFRMENNRIICDYLKSQGKQADRISELGSENTQMKELVKKIEAVLYEV